MIGSGFFRSHISHVNLREDSAGGQGLGDVHLPLPFTNINHKRVILLVHGYNVDKKGAKAAFAAAEAHVRSVAPELLSEIVGLYWPGDVDTGNPLTNALAFPWKVRDTEVLAPVLARFVRDFQLMNPIPCEFVLVGHSLGCRLILEAVTALNEDPTYTRRHPLVLAILMAAAVPVSYMSPKNRLFEALPRVDRWVVLYSRNDRVLRYTFPPGQRAAAGNAGLLPEAVGLRGMPRPAAWHDREEMRSFQHGDYWLGGGFALRLAKELGILNHSGSQPLGPLAANVLPVNADARPRSGLLSVPNLRSRSLRRRWL